MKNQIKHLLLALVLLSALNAQLSTAFAQGTAFTYQGRLQNNGSLANGLYDFQFSLSNAPSGGSQVGSTVTDLAVGVTNGLFTVTLDFGPVFTGNATWLAIGVRTNGGAGFSTLNPLQELTPTPYAIYTPNAGNALTAMTANTAVSAISAASAATAITAITATSFTGSLAGDVTGTQSATVVLTSGGNAIVTNNETGVTLSGAFSGDGSGLTNLSAVQFTSLPSVPQMALLKWWVGQTENTLSVGSHPIGICFDGASIWVANYGDNTVTKL